MNKKAPEPAREVEVLRPPFKRSAESEKLEAHLCELAEQNGSGASCSYVTIRNIIGENPQQGSGYAITMGVRTRLITEGQVWFVEPGLGLKLATEEEKIQIAQCGFVSVARKNNKTKKVLSAVEYNGLTNDQQKEYFWLMSISGTLRLFLSHASQKKLREAVQTEQKEIDPRLVFRIFGEK